LGYIEKNLIPGEKIVYKTGLHWVVMLGPILLGAVFAALGIFLLVRAKAGDLIRAESARAAEDALTLLVWFGLALLVIAAVCVVIGYFKRSATEMSVTTKRVVIKKGIGARVTYEMLLAKVESIGVEESVWGRMLGYGTVVVRGTGGTPEPFDRIAHPLEFRRQVEQQIEALSQSAAPRAQNPVT
jgi:uncharacterized membrane protein YdbT with pleckstrin-like domain